MISRPRSSVTGALILVLALHPLAAQRTAPAQRGGPPRPDTPQLLVNVLASSDPALGVAASEAIARRIQNQHSATDLYVVPRTAVEKSLESYGYNPDTTLSQSDLMTLARSLRGDYALDGTIERTPSGVRTSIRVLTQKGQLVVAEPLAPMIGPDFGDIAKQVDRALTEVLRVLSFHRDCMNALVLGDYARAMAVAQEGLRIRAGSVALNQCVLATLRATHAGADSLIAVASAITAADSENVAAWATLGDAYAQRGDSAHALDAARVLHRLEPGNQDFTANLVDRLVGAGQAEPALGVLDSVLRTTPGDPALLKKRWLLHLRLGRFEDALASGRALVAADSSAATADYFERQLAAAKAGHDSVAAHTIALDAAAHFPRNIDFLITLARDAVDRGAPVDALPLLERVLSIDPANVIAWQLAIAAHAKANGSDSALAVGRRALAAGVNRDAVGTSLVTLVAPALSAAQTSQKREDWEATLRMAQVVDSVASTARSAYYVGASAYQVASDDIQSLSSFVSKRSPSKADRDAACASATRAESLAATVAIAMPKGGSIDPTTAGKILNALPAMSEFVASVKQATCRPH